MKNKVVIISGGTSGIGLATAKILVSEGWKTILLGRDMSKGRGAQEEFGAIQQQDVHAVPLQLEYRRLVTQGRDGAGRRSGHGHVGGRPVGRGDHGDLVTQGGDGGGEGAGHVGQAAGLGERKDFR